MKKCAVYARYSSDMQHPRTIDQQLSECRRFIADHKWAMAENHIYLDKGVSGSDITRKGYQNLLATAKGGEFDCIIVDDLSRFGRDLAECTRALEELAFHQVDVWSVSEGALTGRQASDDYYVLKAVSVPLALG